MSTIITILVTLGGFFSIFKSIKSLDKIYHIDKNGKRANATVINIREKKSTDSDGHSTFSYYYLVSFLDNRGKKIEHEIEFPINEKNNRKPPFSTTIKYSKDKKDNYSVILENNKGRNSSFIFSLVLGIGMLTYVVFNYNGEFDIIINYMENLFKWKQ